MIFLSLLGSLIPLVIFGGIIWAIVKAVQSRSDNQPDESDNSLRRFFLYVLLYGAFVSIITGLLSLASALFPHGQVIARSASTDVARGLALVIVGVPVYWMVFRIIENAFATDAEEKRRLGWSTYLNAAIGTSLIGAIVTFTQLIASIVGSDAVRAVTIADAALWSGAWAIHWFVLISRHGIRTDAHLAIGSTIGLAITATGFGLIVDAGLDAAYEAMFLDQTAGPGVRDVLDMPVALGAVGLGVWTIYWLTRYFGEVRSTLWHTYVVLAGVLAGLITAVIGGAVVIGTVLQWWFGSPGTDSASEHFLSIPGALAALLVGGGVWWYHRAVLHAGGTPERTEPMRIHDYAAAAVGLIAALVGLTTIFVALLEALTAPTSAAGARPENTLVLAVTALIVGGPLWWVMWSRTERLGDAEKTSASRRTYVVGILGMSAITAAVSLAIVLFVFLEDTLDGILGAATVYDFRVALALLVSLGGVAWYHFQIRQRDAAVAPEPKDVAPGPRNILVVGGDTQLLDELAGRTSARVSHWTRLDEAADSSAVDVDALVERLAGHVGEQVMVVLDGGQPQVIPYRR
ncbi:MAG: hypothetical protein HKN07_05170 [Acidimicrobiia bacterium]|nr:hypothetical protein [Acidimicrobiia bacterium]